MNRTKTALLIPLFCFFLLLIYRVTAPPGFTWAHGGVDGGELALASTYLGVAHPPGYMLYTLVGFGFMQFPLGTPFQRLQWFSHLAALLACGILALAVREVFREQVVGTRFTASAAADVDVIPTPPLITERAKGGSEAAEVGAQRRPRRGSEILSALLALGLSATFWSQAIIVEVYVLLTLFFCVGLLLSVRAWRSNLAPLVAGHVLGLALTHHLTVILWLPGFAVLNWRRSWRDKGLVVLGAISGLWPLALLLLRAGQSPANWGGLETGLPALWDHLSGRLYTMFLRPFTAENLLAGITGWFAQLPNEITWLGIALAVIGIVYAVRRRWFRLLGAILLWVVCLSAFTGLYSAVDTVRVYPLPLSALAALLIAFGAAALIERWRSLQWITPLVLGGVLIASNFAQADLHEDIHTVIYIKEATEAFPSDSIVVTNSTEALFTFWYYQLEGIGTDLVIVDRNLWRFDWYRRNLARQYPQLAPFEGAVEQWVRSDALARRTLAAESFLPPPPNRQTQRVGEWYLLPP